MAYPCKICYNNVYLEVFISECHSQQFLKKKLYTTVTCNQNSFKWIFLLLTSPYWLECSLPLLCWAYLRKHENIFVLSIFSQLWDGTGSWNPSWWKTRNHLIYIVHACSCPVVQGARSSAAMVLTNLTWNIPFYTSDLTNISYSNWLGYFHCCCWRLSKSLPVKSTAFIGTIHAKPITLQPFWQHILLTHLPLDKMTAISQMIFSVAFLWMKSCVFWLKFHWSLFLRVQWTITQHWFR